jgi:hypothetical protein
MEASTIRVRTHLGGLVDRGGVAGMLAEHADPAGDGIEGRAKRVGQELTIVFRRADQEVEISLELPPPRPGTVPSSSAAMRCNSDRISSRMARRAE